MLDGFEIPVTFSPDIVKPLSARYSRIYKERKEWPELPKFNKDHITTQDVLRALLTTPKTKNEQLMKDFLSKPEIVEETISKATKQDFRAFLRDMLDQQRDNIPDSLLKLREEEGEAEYQRALQSWAKIALPPQDKTVSVDVEINQRVHMYDRLSQMYGFSKEIESTHHGGRKDILQLESPSDRMASLPDATYPIQEIPDDEYEEFDPFADEDGTLDGVEADEEDDDHPLPTPIKITKDNKYEDQ